MKIVDMKTKLQALWIFAMFNYLYADVMSLMDPIAHRNIEAGTAGSVAMTPGFLLGAAVLMETAIAMVVLTRVLGHRANRWANVIAGFIHTAAMSLAMLIIWLALRWKPQAAAMAVA